MTKRTAALAAAAKLSAKKKPPTKKSKDTSTSKANTPKSKLANTTKDNTEQGQKNLPWYTVYTKSDPEYDRYMSTEWGFEKRGDKALFEKICLEGAQSGLSWLTILRKREAYRTVFSNFEIDKVAAMTPQDVQRIIDMDEPDPSNMIVRHRGKIEATIHNAKCLQAMYKEHESSKQKQHTQHGFFDSFLWSFVNDKPILNTQWKQGESLATALSKTPESEAMSKALKQKGFRFVGPTTCYALMQSVGMVIDHPVESPEWHQAVVRLEQRPGGYQKDVDARAPDDQALKRAAPKSSSTKTTSRKKAKK